MRRIVPIVVLTLLLTMTAFVAAAAETRVVVTPNDLETETDYIIAGFNSGRWFFYNDENEALDSSLGSFVWGPVVAPSGAGSAQISVSGTQRRNLATYQFRGTVLSTITELAFSTYNPSAGNGGSATRSGFLQFNVDFDGSDTWQRRLTFLPGDNGTVLQDTWQEWDAINGGNALWRHSGPTWPNTATPGSTPKTWNDILTEYPGVRIRVTDAWLGIRVGEPYSDGYTENIDAFKFGVASGTMVFDFEPPYFRTCLFAGSLSQVGATEPSCGRGTQVVLAGGEDLWACLHAGGLSRVGYSEPSCTRGYAVGFESGTDLRGCLFAGTLSRVGTPAPACGRGQLVGFTVPALP